MYKYKFIKINTIDKLSEIEPTEDYHEIIYEFSKDGWRLIQIFSTPVSDYFELIFEKKMS